MEATSSKSQKLYLDPRIVTKKWQLASDLFEIAFKTKQFQMKKKYPHLSEKEINHKAYELIEKGCR